MSDTNKTTFVGGNDPAIDLSGDLTDAERAELQSEIDEQAEAKKEEEAKAAAEQETPEKEGKEPEAAAAKDKKPEPEALEVDEKAADAPEGKKEEAEPEGPPEIVEHRGDEIGRRYANTDFDAVMKNIDKKRAELTKKYEDGEIDQVEYLDGREKLLEDKARVGQIREIVSDYNLRQADAQAKFNAAEEAFFSDESNRVFAENAVAQQQMQSMIDHLVSSGKAQGKSWGWVFNEAKRQVLAFATTLTGAPETGKSKPPADEKPPTRKMEEVEQRQQAPRTLSKAPAAADNIETQSKYDWMDSAPIQELEQWMAEHGDEAEKALYDLEQDRQRRIAESA